MVNSYFESAVEDNDVPTVRELLRDGESPDDYVFFLAIRRNSNAVLRVLIKAGANLNAVEHPKGGGNTPLMRAIESKNMQAFRLLLKAGALINKRGSAGMRRILQFIHHRSLTAAIVALVLALLACGFFPDYAYRLQQQGRGYLMPATVTALMGLIVCGFTLFVLIRDNRRGYPSYRCSLATLLWALACVPVFALTAIVIRGFLK